MSKVDYEECFQFSLENPWEDQKLEYRTSERASVTCAAEQAARRAGSDDAAGRKLCGRRKTCTKVTSAFIFDKGILLSSVEASVASLC